MYKSNIAKGICLLTEKITTLYIPRILRPFILNTFSTIFGVNLNEVENPISTYTSINKFFTRGLKKDCRTIDPLDTSLTSPVDGKTLIFDNFKNNTLIQAKGINFSVNDLLSHDLSSHFQDGQFITVYLSPKDCHRIFSPCDGEIIGYSYVPGALYPVRSPYIENLDGLYIKNERVTTFIQTPFGKIALVKVAAMNVSSISLEYDKTFNQSSDKQTSPNKTFSAPISIKKGEWISTFNLGSTIVLLLEKSMKTNFIIEQKSHLNYGQKIATLTQIIKDHTIDRSNN